METPFKFLEAYGKTDRNLFFGRDEEIASLYSLVKKSNLVIVYGKSGVGKTSLIKCGLANEFDENEIKIIEVRRHVDINEALKKELKKLLKSDAAEEKSAAELVEKVYNRYLQPVYLFFDQFEELFILGDTIEKNIFLRHLTEIRALDIPCVVTLIIRQEYLAELTAFKKEFPFLFDHTLQIGQMDQVKSVEVVNKIFDKLLEENYAIENKEHQLVKINYDKNITPDIINIVSNGNFFIELPYLQVYLDKLFKIGCEKANGQLVFNKELLADERVSKIEPVINNLLDEQIKKATEKSGETSDAKVLSFLKIFVTDQDTKKPVTFLKLHDTALDRGLTKEQVEIYIEIFTNALLIRPLEGNQYELSHDSVAKKIALKRSDNKRLEPVIQGNPYKGLTAFTENEEDIKRFFGRSEAIDKVLFIVEAQKLIVISGASGTGKSSLVKAGIFPELRRRGYKKFEFRPGDYPLASLNKIIDSIKPGESGRSGYLLLIDQYEELITRSKSEEDVEEFKRKLLLLLENPVSLLPGIQETESVKIIITVRSDFEPQFKAGILEKYWDKGRYVVPYMSTHELEQVIENPAELAACYFEPLTLIKNIAEEVSGRPSALPLLSFALSLMYEASLPERIITKEIYNKIGVFGALQTKANKIYNAFESPSRRTMQQVLLRMVSLEGSEIASRRVNLEELDYPSAEENERVTDVLDALIKERLIIKLLDENEMKYVEPAHDALLKGWTKLWDWIKDFGKENILFRERLNAAIIEWKAHDKTVNALWTDEKRIYEIKDLLNSDNNWLNKVESEFCEASLVEGKNTEKQRASRRRIFVAILAASIIFLVLAVWGFGNARLAKQNESIAVQQRDTALLLKRQADSFLNISRIRTDEANKAKSEAEINLERAMAGESTIKDALGQLKKEKEQTEKQRLLAVQNARLALTKVGELSVVRDSLIFSNQQYLFAEKLAIQRADSMKILNGQLENEREYVKGLNAQLEEINRGLGDSIITKDSAIQSLSGLASYEEKYNSGPQIQNYQDKLSKATSYRALWPPNYKLKIGDIGKFYKGEFKVEGNLGAFNIPLRVKDIKVKDTSNYGYTQSKIDISNENDTWTLKFPANNFLAKMHNAVIKQITNLDDIADSVRSLYNKGSWDKNWLIITELVETNNGVIIICSEKKSGKLIISDKSGKKNMDGNLPTDFVILKSENIPVVLMGPLTPLFKVMGLRNASLK